MSESANSTSTSVAVATEIPSIPTHTVHAFGSEMHFFQTGAETGGLFDHWLEITPPGGGPPPHYHEKDEEWFYVLKGKVSFYSGGEWHESPPGTRVHIPPTSVHTFKNTGDEPLHMLITTAPSGFSTFMTRCAAEFAAPGGPDMPRIIAIAGEHGIHFAEK